MKKILLCVLCLCVLLSSCKNSGQNNENSSEQSSQTPENTLTSLSLPFWENDSFNPYTVKSSLNISLMPLLYDSLVTVDNNFGYSCLLASSITRTSPLTIEVSLNEGVKFSSGEILTPNDIVFSFNEHKRLGSFYGKRLSEFASANTVENKVVFTLASPDRYAENNLDFPITSSKAGSASPIGSGRYTLTAEKSLIPNKNHFKTTAFTLEKISLTSTEYNDSLFSSIKAGNIDLVPADISLGSFTGNYAQTKSVNTSNLVFLGVGNKISDLSLRKYINASLDRSKAVISLPASSITTSSLPLHPKKADIADTDLNLTTKDEKAKSYLSESFTFDESGILYNGTEKVTLTLLYLNESSEKTAVASALADSLRKSGIEITLIGKNYNDYMLDISNRSYDLYLGEIRLSNSLNLKSLVSGGFSSPFSENLLNIYDSFERGEKTPTEFLTVFNEELPFMPIFFKNTALTYSKSIKSGVDISITDCYLSIQKFN